MEEQSCLIHGGQEAEEWKNSREEGIRDQIKITDVGHASVTHPHIRKCALLIVCWVAAKPIKSL